MYKCESCGKTTALSEKMERVVTERRDRVYTAVDRRGREYEQGRGWEIVKEIAVCKSCFKKYNKTDESNTDN